MTESMPPIPWTQLATKDDIAQLDRRLGGLEGRLDVLTLRVDQTSSDLQELTRLVAAQGASPGAGMDSLSMPCSCRWTEGREPAQCERFSTEEQVVIADAGLVVTRVACSTLLVRFWRWCRRGVRGRRPSVHGCCLLANGAFAAALPHRGGRELWPTLDENSNLSCRWRNAQSTNSAVVGCLRNQSLVVRRSRMGFPLLRVALAD
jgi:hypothetical protein